MKKIKTFESYNKFKTILPMGTIDQGNFVEFAYNYNFINDNLYNDFRFFTHPDGNLTYDNIESKNSELTKNDRIKEIIDAYNAKYNKKIKLINNKIIL
jgi:hypothetical protein